MNGDERQPLFIDLTTPPSNNSEGRIPREGQSENVLDLISSNNNNGRIRKRGQGVNVLNQYRKKQASKVNTKNTLSEISVNSNDLKNITISVLICVILYLLSHK